MHALWRAPGSAHHAAHAILAMLSWRSWPACRAHLLIQHLLRRELCAGAGEAPLPLWGETHGRRGRLLHGSDPLWVW